MNVKSTLRNAEALLRESGSPSARLDGEVLLGWCLDVGRISLHAHSERFLTDDERERFGRALARRSKGEPVAYIVGEKEFWSLSMTVSNDVLIPRPDTETVVEETLELLNGIPPPEGKILEIGTGSGAIGIALAREAPGRIIVATDTSEAALALAINNARKHGVDDRIMFLCGDLFGPLEEKFDIVCSNPPYIADNAWQSLPRGVRDFEPREALVAGPEGTGFHKRLIDEAHLFLIDGGWLIMEIGDGQRRQVDELFEDSGLYDRIHSRRDMTGRDRVMAGRKKAGRYHNGQDHYPGR
ncbi:MAG: peptide chain release factor N(5)-glutamine methyltransferase [Syntrophales bacterium]|jgi:release factor glutamine methyltransferase|nr:peptide chain release factor N(5)-glutamine methyltransferase [Syntrophales bacterium]MCK9527524.1 peptide chain release factor N(5)-glutamine methyltransferase [Syntrophales bacterium]MDX9922581.1 peptide chain release factor N(5)-glutamine methyltransferase [Syntrophales bacterium]